MAGMFSLSNFPFFPVPSEQNLFGISNNLNSKCQVSIRVEIFLFCSKLKGGKTDRGCLSSCLRTMGPVSKVCDTKAEDGATPCFAAAPRLGKGRWGHGCSPNSLWHDRSQAREPSHPTAWLTIQIHRILHRQRQVSDSTCRGTYPEG